MSFFGIKTEHSYIFNKLREADEKLTEKEKMALQFLFEEVGNGTSCTLQELKKYGEDNANEASNFWNKWQEAVKAEAKQLGLIRKKVLVFR